MKIAIMIIIAYLLGSIPSGVWIGKLFFHEDIRLKGSGNIGTTNTFRVLGKKAGIAVLLIDILKGTLAASQPYLFGMSHVNPLVIGLFASLGHTCSIFDHFHGGKAVATSAGILLAYNPLLFLMASTFFVSTLLLTSMASAASIIGITLTTIVALFLQDWILAIIAGILSIVVIWRHRSNISRIFNGTESMVSFGLGNYLRHKKNS
ncbi:membrane protein [Paucilactobacillus vaccinostercus DSM 20634]|jgi:glycerol-3-phosphate acyltransferase PlsY|uniref:Glycerol-3-phosphate acyltransferase n=1 Tax=Paucilactobacillus vaccinostercus DSM 20634 TaxID=1423813 RepID=A0A0R2A654_9LACO|nr:glycerol-3-phosphate 1-O-acyltransferase PlsY [Paucilactobacillus vaccinostercus]KRM62551.1 membrane protein [Paucilactobacillus vaccinostercus DSM 20634]RRG09708.1 MAG: glycerol-3-phosphate acyltransferase [Lactobacillus sp.]